MIGFFAKRLIPDYENLGSPAVRRGYGFLCALIGIIFNLLLFGGKLFAGFISGSIAITADAFNNLSDAGSSLISLLGFKMAAQKPDMQHPFGHGRFEYIAGFVVSLVILFMGFELGLSSIDKIRSPQPIEVSAAATAILAVSVLVKLYMALYNHRIGSKIQSGSMRATGKDSLSDAVSTSAVLVSMLLVHFWGINADGWFGMLVALFILYTGIKSIRETIDPLLGQAPDPHFVRQVEAFVLTSPAIVGVHDLIVHDYGPGRRMITLHAEVPADGDLLELHDAVDLMERQLQQEYHCHAVIHMDPIITDDAHINTTRERTLETLRELDPVITLHDFRMVEGPTHTNLIFDVLVPHDFCLSDEEVQREVARRIHGLNPNYFTIVTVDKFYFE